jgi:hypothetical protein
LRELERRGLTVRRYQSTAAVDRMRCEMATAALKEGFDELIWIDSDIAFAPDDVARLRAHDLPIVAGVYAKKGPQAFAAYFEPDTPKIQLGTGGGLMHVRYVGFGFVCTRRPVYDDMQEHFSLPFCNTRFGQPAVPYFLPMVIEDAAQPGGYWYLGEDYAFCERARRVGYDIVLDTAIRLGHIGAYQYGWEDAVQKVPRVGGLTIHLPGDVASEQVVEKVGETAAAASVGSGEDRGHAR